MLCTRCLRLSATSRHLQLLRRLSTSQSGQLAEPQLSTPISDVGEAPRGPAARRSVCEAGTVLKGLNYMKGGQDPVALEDAEYPEWLWSCLEVMQKRSDAAVEEGGDEFSKSKKERRLAAKRQKATEAKLLAEGNLTALTNTIPLQHQSVNLPGREGGSVEENIEAAKRREELKRAMRVERKAKIKESNYLKSM